MKDRSSCGPGPYCAPQHLVRSQPLAAMVVFLGMLRLSSWIQGRREASGWVLMLHTEIHGPTMATRSASNYKIPSPLE